MPSPRPAIAVLCLVQFVDVLGVGIVITALPSMLDDLGAPEGAATPVVTGYAMFFGGLLMLGSRLGDRIGHRRTLVVGLALFGAASVTGALAPSALILTLARCAQGAAAALSVPSALRLLSAAAPDEDRRRRGLAAWSAAGAVAGTSGLVLGGVLTQAADWPWVFWINIPLAAGLIAAVLRLVPSTAPVGALGFDVAGSVLLTASVMAVVLGCALLERPAGRLAGGALVLVGAALLALFALQERRARGALISPAAARNANLRTGCAASFANTASTSSATTIATLYLQDDLGRGPAATGFTLVPLTICVVLAAGAASARLMRRIGPAATAGAGLAVIAVGDAMLIASPGASAVLPIAVGIAGLGLGLASVAANAIGTDVPDDLAGTAAGLLNTAAQIGAALGVAVAILVATSTESWTAGGPRLGWATAALIAAAAAVALRPWLRTGSMSTDRSATRTR